jgi:hypothetical protein
MRTRLSIPVTLSVVVLTACGTPAPGGDAAPQDTPVADATPSTCTDPNALPVDSNFGCWTCPPPPATATMHLGQPTGYRCSVCTPDPRITQRPRGDCLACVPPEGGAPQGFC